MSTKEKILLSLKSNQNQVISGQKLAEECNVSRAAVWKAIKALREGGFLIEATTNNGYRLSSDDCFSEEAFKQSLAKDFPEFSDCHIEVFS